MKKLAIVLLLTCSYSTYARSPLRLGIKAGADVSRVGIADDIYVNNENASFGLGFYGGGLLEISGPAGSKFKGQIEALFAQQYFNNGYSYIINPNDIDIKTSVSRISVPVSVKYFIIPSLSINVGGSVHFNLASKSAIKRSKFIMGDTSWEINNKERDFLQTIQVGALAGVTYYIYKGFFIDARYNYYFGKVLDMKNALLNYKNMSSIQVGLGYKF